MSGRKKKRALSRGALRGAATGILLRVEMPIAV